MMASRPSLEMRLDKRLTISWSMDFHRRDYSLTGEIKHIRAPSHKASLHDRIPLRGFVSA